MAGSDDLSVVGRDGQRISLDHARLEALLRLNQMTGAPLQEVTDFALEEAVRLTSSRLGYLAFTSEDESILTMHSWSKTAMAQCAIQDKPIVYPVVDTGLWGEAVRQRKPVITNDYPAPNPLKKGYPEGHVHIARHMNLPVFEEGRIVLVAGVGNKAEPYDDSDVRQLTLLMQGMWQLLRRREIQEQLERRTEDLARANQALERQAREMLELSTPVIQLWDGLILVPLIGSLDSRRTEHLMERLLERIVETHAAVAIVDITGVPCIDTSTARNLLEAFAAVRLLGARVILTGVRPAIAQTMVHLGIDLGNIETCSLARGVRSGFDRIGLEVVPRGPREGAAQ